ncbi:MAG: anhydro-N-acetylmuramic acid kinase, partial [Siphonobacter sp.]
KYYDKDSELALQGNVNLPLLEALLDDDFFRAPFPKTTGPELFNLQYLEKAIQKAQQPNLAVTDILATLARFSAQGIIQALETTVSTPDFEVYVSGGGMHNPLLMSYLEQYLGRNVKTTFDLGIDPDAKEAVLFALLANEAVAGTSEALAFIDKFPAISMGKVSFPG